MSNQKVDEPHSNSQVEHGEHAPWFKCNPKDYLGDPRLSLLSPASYGTWWRLLLVSYSEPRPGIITGTPERLAKLGHCSAKQFNHLVDEATTLGLSVVLNAGICEITFDRLRIEVGRLQQDYIRQKRKRDRDSAALVTDLSRVDSRSQNPDDRIQNSELEEEPEGEIQLKNRSTTTMGTMTSDSERPSLTLVRSGTASTSRQVRELKLLCEMAGYWSDEHMAEIAHQYGATTIEELVQDEATYDACKIALKEMADARYAERQASERRLRQR